MKLFSKGYCPVAVDYDWPGECLSVWRWLLCSWDFMNADGYREWGVRVFGLVLSNWRSRVKETDESID